MVQKEADGLLFRIESIVFIYLVSRRELWYIIIKKELKFLIHHRFIMQIQPRDPALRSKSNFKLYTTKCQNNNIPFL